MSESSKAMLLEIAGLRLLVLLKVPQVAEFVKESNQPGIRLFLGEVPLEALDQDQFGGMINSLSSRIPVQSFLSLGVGPTMALVSQTSGEILKRVKRDISRLTNLHRYTLADPGNIEERQPDLGAIPGEFSDPSIPILNSSSPTPTTKE